MNTSEIKMDSLLDNHIPTIQSKQIGNSRANLAKDLKKDTLKKIFSFLSDTKLPNMCMVNKHWNATTIEFTREMIGHSIHNFKYDSHTALGEVKKVTGPLNSERVCLIDKGLKYLEEIDLTTALNNLNDPVHKPRSIQSIYIFFKEFTESNEDLNEILFTKLFCPFQRELKKLQKTKEILYPGHAKDSFF